QALAEAFDDRPRRLRRDGRQRLLVAQQIHQRRAHVLPLPGHGPGLLMDNGIAQPAHGFSSPSCTNSPPAAKRRGEFSFRHRWTAPGRQATNAVLILSGVTTTMAPLAQTPSHKRQPTQDFGSTSSARPLNSSPVKAKQSKGQMSTQKLQPVQLSGSTTGLGQLDRPGMRLSRFPN